MQEKKTKPTKKNDVPKRDKSPWWKFALKILAMLVWAGASTIVSQLIIGRLMILMIGVDNFLQPVPTAIYSALSYILAMFMIILLPPIVISIQKSRDAKKAGKKSTSKVVAIDRKKMREELGLKGLLTWTDFGLAPVGFVVYLLVAAGITALFSVFPWFDANEAQEVGFNYYVNGIDRMIAFVVLVVIAPIAEEIIFRGWLYGKLRNTILGKFSNTVSVIASTLLVSLVFGIVHLQWNVGVNVFAMSIVLCVLREITGTIHSGILLHIIKNCVAFYLLYVVGIR
ncbi:CPBP family intramembrane metalloprotease [Candidatus Saccharibacteria bacterium]|nr:CPBP family intramembrane metalloprotease [Candidatus Saccharibacteria bacterium]